MDHYEELGDLWQRCGRDLSSAIHEAAGFCDSTEALDRLTENWKQLAELDLDVAAMLYHGIEQVQIVMARRGGDPSPSDRAEHHLKEVLGMATIAREKYPDAQVDTLEELLDLGDKAIQDEIDNEFGGT
jgi:hypothetical protein